MFTYRRSQPGFPGKFSIVVLLLCLGMALSWAVAGAADVAPQSPAAKAPADAGKPAPAKPSPPAPNCTTCHSKPEYLKNFSETKHGSFGCAFCHKGVANLGKHMRGNEPVTTLPCLTCHRNVQKQGFHTTVTNFACSQCHGAVHPREPVAPKKPKTAPIVQAPVMSVANCASCHSGPKYSQHFAQTAHGNLKCTICHSGITDLALHMKKQQKPALTSCVVCHKDIEKTYAASYHAATAKLSCLKCHTDIHPTKAVSGKKDKAAIIQACTRCHRDTDKYVAKGHGAKVLAGEQGCCLLRRLSRHSQYAGLRPDG